MNNAPIREPAGDSWPASWSIWFSQLVSCLPWKKAFNVTAGIDFGLVPANGQLASSGITVKGSRRGDAVTVTPYSDVSGLIFTGTVTADDAVTVYAKNFTTIGINPNLNTFRIIVKQN